MMSYIFKILALLTCLLAISVPASALVTNLTNPSTEIVSNSFLHDSHYMPVEYVYALIIIGLACLILSRVIESAEDILSIGAIIPIGLSAWFANYMSVEQVDVTQGIAGPIVVNTQIVTPSPYLSIVMVVFFILSFVNLIWLLYLRDADRKVSGE